MVLLDVLAMLRSTLPEARPTVVLGDDGPLRAQIEALGVPCEVLPLPEGVARLGDAGGRRAGYRNLGDLGGSQHRRDHASNAAALDAMCARVFRVHWRRSDRLRERRLRLTGSFLVLNPCRTRLQ